jgi:kinase-associated protein B
MIVNDYVFTTTDWMCVYFMNHLREGAIVVGIYKTGKYVGKILDMRDERLLITIQAVLKHPTQGDLHAPQQVNVPLFHRRKALSHNEKVWLPLSVVKHFNDEVPTYTDSLNAALLEQERQLKALDSDWAIECLKCLEELQEDYKLLNTSK